ncbi:hypothetical protein ACFORL_04075 [Legionella dresdenensis]|uniref:Uncharacterized protein n=1 Tax=Legionella dresdenensis TaxID=450200 RepID=A0ABV8CDI7_9GAMM
MPTPAETIEQLTRIIDYIENTMSFSAKLNTGTIPSTVMLFHSQGLSASDFQILRQLLTRYANTLPRYDQEFILPQKDVLKILNDTLSQLQASTAHSTDQATPAGITPSEPAAPLSETPAVTVNTALEEREESSVLSRLIQLRDHLVKMDNEVSGYAAASTNHPDNQSAPVGVTTSEPATRLSETPAVTVNTALQERKKNISQSNLRQILASYKSTSFLGFLSSLWFFSSFISPMRSKAMIELNLLLQYQEISSDQIKQAISKDSDGKRRLSLFQSEDNAIKNNSSSTDNVIEQLKQSLM